MSRTSDRLFQEMVSSAQGPKRPGVPTVRPLGARSATPWVEAHLDLALDGDEWQEEGSPPKLQPGTSYTVTVRVTTQRHSENSPALRVGESGISLSLSSDSSELLVGGVESPEGGIEPASVLLSQNQILAGVEVDFEIEVLSLCCRRKALLNLSCSRPGSAFRLPSLRRSVEIMGEGEPWPDPNLEIWPVDLSLPTPANMIFLYVNEGEFGHLSIQGWNQRRRFGGEKLQKPDISLAAFVKGRMAPRQIVALAHSFSRQRLRDLHVWLKELRKLHGSGLTVVIVDLSDSEVPWEIVSLDDGYLGALFEVVRWGHFWNRGEKSPLLLQQQTRTGSVIWFVDSSVPHSYVTAERTELSTFGSECLESLADVIPRLSRSIEGIGLLYLGCHGAFIRPEREAQQYQALLPHADGPRLLTQDFEYLQDRQVRIPLVFANACHSGRLLGDRSALHGMPSAFLRVAEGYIGTLGEVGQKEAAMIGARVLRALRESPDGLRISEILRQLRSETAKSFDPNLAQDDEWLLFLFTFMYVYYGNPLIRLNLRGSAPGQDDHE